MVVEAVKVHIFRACRWDGGREDKVICLEQRAEGEESEF